jgi:very-short-patch-repair endonuclease
MPTGFYKHKPNTPERNRKIKETMIKKGIVPKKFFQKGNKLYLLVKNRRGGVKGKSGVYQRDPSKYKPQQGFQKGNHPKSEFKKGHKPTKGTLGIKHTEEELRKIRSYSSNPEYKERKRQLRLKQKIPTKETGIEKKVEAELIKRGINYQKQVPLCKISIVDFLLPKQKIVIYCDGDYWHNLPKIKEKGLKQNEVLSLNGYQVYRFWEHEINKSVEECVNKIKLI